MKFPYLQFRGKYYPVVPVVLKKGRNRFKTHALLDSGAMMSLFDASVGRELGIPIEEGERKTFQGASAKLVGYIHKLEIEIGDYVIECKMAFSDDLSTSFNLLGRAPIFDKFLVTFDDKKKQLILKK